ncbi:MAG TPA: tetratricopeptide repeat protein [Candidatus Sulfotelmatobacter sp.]|nr:tetratricopeptide repeat protein [Candidatus Sulfotelmatobacter sp.]
MKPRRKKQPGIRPNLRKNPPTRGPSALSRRKLWFFRLLLAIGVPVIFLGTMELILRLAGFGYPTGFLLSSQQNGEPVFVQNNWFGWRFFGAAMARIPEPFCIPKDKGPNTVRIIVFGESAAQGDPQPHFGLSRMLQAMLELRYPGTHFEVVNAAMVAINSNVILPIARDCAAAGADVWVIYMGNNEVVGPFGAGTVFGQQTPPLPLIRADLALKSTRVGQFMDAVVRRLHKSSMDQNQWGGMEMFLNQQVAADDPRMNAVYDHFARNLADIIRAGKQSGAGVVVSTVAVNLKDCAPFGSKHRPGLTNGDREKWESLYRHGIAAQTAGNFQEASEAFRAAAQIDDHFAELRFRQGSCALALGETDDARKQFIAARDLDTLRFRCDSRLNDLIRKIVADDNDSRVVLADAERSFADHSPNGLPGDELFYEHVHPTFDGNYLLALTLAPKLERLLPANLISQAPASQAWPSEAACARRLAWSDWNHEQALAEMASRLGEPPFTGQLNHDAELKKIRSEIERLMPATQGAGIQAAENLCEQALNSAPDDPVIREQLAVLEQSSGNLADATVNAQRAVDLLPSDSEGWSQLGVILAEQHRYDDAVAAFRHAFQLNPESVWALKNLAQSLNDLGQPEQAIHEYKHALAINPHFGPAWLGLGEIYDKMGDKSEAEDCYQKALSNRVKNGVELTTLARFCESRGWHEAAATNYADAIELSPADATLYVEAGQNLDALGRHTDAEKLFSDAAKLSPDSMEAHFLYGLELGRDGNAAGAAEQFGEAVRIMPNLAEARLDFGIALENEGKYSEALLQFEKVLDQDPANPTALGHAKMLQQKLSQTSAH